MRPFNFPNKFCCVYGCKSTGFGRKGDVVLHPFPPKETLSDGRELIYKWVEAIKLPGRVSRRMRVCSLHFTPEDYLVQDGTKTLKSSAVPSCNLPHVCRNKFSPRDYGKLLKLLEFRGIGRLRLSFESKLSRKMKVKRKKSSKKYNGPPSAVEPNAESDNKKKERGVLPVISAPFSISKEAPVESLSEDQPLASINEIPENNNTRPAPKENQGQHLLTSEIEIKEEPISDQEEAVDDYRLSADEMMYDTQDPQVKDSDPTMDDNEPDFICNICGEEDCGGHEELELFECFPCGKIFRTSRQLNAHNLCHFEYKNRGGIDGGERIAICKVCNKVLPSTVRVTEHMQVHSGEKPHVCLLCDKSFRHKVNLVQHVNSHTVKETFKCKVCKVVFQFAEELDAHVRSHKIVKKEYSCRECGLKFRSKTSCWSHLNSHIRNRSKPGLECSLCGRILSTKATLKEHMFIHSGEKPFECLLCGKKIRHRANFIIHVQGHSLGQPHSCAVCRMSFAKKSELNTHMQVEHIDERPYQCSICNLTFRNEGRFLKHAVTHDACLEEEQV